MIGDCSTLFASFEATILQQRLQWAITCPEYNPLDFHVLSLFGELLNGKKLRGCPKRSVENIPETGHHQPCDLV